MRRDGCGRSARDLWQQRFASAAFRGRGVAREWLSLLGLGSAVPAVKALGLECDEGHADWGRAYAIAGLGLTVARIVPEKAQAKEPPRWRFAERGEKSEAALILPVAAYDRFGLSASMSLNKTPAAEFAEGIADLIAIPVKNGRARSYTGLSASVGMFAADEHGTLILHGSGLSWLKRYLGAVLASEESVPPTQAARYTHAPDCLATLVLRPDVFEWRRGWPGCCYGRDVERIDVKDSRALAVAIQALTNKREAAPPAVLAPAERSAA